MTFEFNDAAFNAYAKKKIDAGLDLVGQFVVGQAAKKAEGQFQGLGKLAGSIFHRVISSDNLVRISANTIYAAIQELGGDIKPDKAKALTVPIHPDAKGKKASDFNDLTLIKRKNGPPLLVRITGKGKKQRMDIMFVLLTKVTIPSRPYLRPAVYENKSTILKVFAKVSVA